MSRRTDPKGMEIVDTRPQMEKALDLVEDLHTAGFNSVWLESMKMFLGGLRVDQAPQMTHFHLRVIIDEVEIHCDRLEKINEVAAKHNATVGLKGVRLGSGVEISRIAIWPEAKA